MHGRVKVRTSEEQAEAKRLQQQEKLKVYNAITQKIFQKRSDGDLDDEALQLTAGVLEKNADFYTFWNYRRQILLKLKNEKTEEELKEVVRTELDLTQNCLKSNPKSYAAWQHRYWSMDFQPGSDWRRELQLCDFFLSKDERNFHCWDYRRLAAKRCGVPAEEELKFSESLIEKNFSNYSAWHYRSKLLPSLHCDHNSGGLKEEVLLNEFKWIQNAAFTDPDDQSVWFYHRWLLGREKAPIHILNVSFFKRLQMVAVLLSQTAKVNKQLTLFVDKSNVHADWRPVNSKSSASSIWLCELHRAEDLGDHSTEITVALSEEGHQSSVSCCLDRDVAFAWAEADRADMFRSQLSAATKEVLENELESCRQLNEMEPDCKWTLFTCVLLMRALDHESSKPLVSDFMQRLTQVDSMRRNYYNDLGSKFAIEDTLASLPFESTEVDLSCKSLTRLHHMDQLLLVRRVDLSSNALTSVRALCVLIGAETILLDGNLLSSLEGLEGLPNLRVLSARTNLIKLVSCIEELKGCHNLQELNLEKNPVVDDSEYPIALKKIVSLKVVDGLSA